MVTILFGYGSQNRYFFNEVIGWEGGGDFKGNQIRRKCLVECEYDQNKICTYFDLNVI